MNDIKNLFSWYFWLRIFIQNEEFASFSSEVSMEVSSLSPFHSEAFQDCVSPLLVFLNFLFYVVNHFDMLGKNTDVST